MALSLYYIIRTCIYIHIYIYYSAWLSNAAQVYSFGYPYVHVSYSSQATFIPMPSFFDQKLYINSYIYMYICIYIVAIYPSPIRIYVSISCTPMIYPIYIYPHLHHYIYQTSTRPLHITNQIFVLYKLHSPSHPAYIKKHTHIHTHTQTHTQTHTYLAR